MLKRFFALFAFINVFAYSAAFASQPTVRAGSISLNSGVKPAAANVTSTTGTAQTVATNDRGAIRKIPAPVTTVTMGKTNNNSGSSSSGGTNVSSATLNEIQEQIAALRAAQEELERSQLKVSEVERTVENQIKNADLTTDNADLKAALREIQSQNQELQTSVTSVQESIVPAVDNRLKVTGVMDTNNNLNFVKKSDIAPEAIAGQIVANPTATAILQDTIQTKPDDVKKIVGDELVEYKLLKNDKTLNVAKKEEIKDIDKTAVVNALKSDNGEEFERMVDTAVRKQYMAGDMDADFVTTRNKESMLSAYATKEEVKPDAIAEKIAINTTATKKIGDIIDDKLVAREILKSDKTTLNVEKAGEVKVTEDTVLNALKNSDTFNTKVADIVSDKYLSDNAQIKLVKSGDLNTELSKYAKTNDIIGSDNKLKVELPDNVIKSDKFSTELAKYATKDEVKPDAIAAKIAVDTTAANKIGEIIDDKLTRHEILKNGALNVDKKGEVEVTEESVLRALKDNTIFAKAADVESAYAKKGEVKVDETTVLNALNDSKTFNTKVADIVESKYLSDDAPVKLVKSGDLNTELSKYATKSEVDPEEIAKKMASDTNAAKKIGEIIDDKLTSHEILKDGSLNVDKKGEVEVTEESVLKALKDNTTFAKAADIENTYAKKDDVKVDETAVLDALKDSKNFDAKVADIVNDKYLSDNAEIKLVKSGELNKYAKTEDIIDKDNKLKVALPDTVLTTGDKLAQELKELEVLDENGKVKAGVDESQVAGVVVDTLKDKNILDKDTGNLAIATSGEITTLTTKVTNLENKAVTDTNLSGKLKDLEVLDENGKVKAGVDESQVAGVVVDTLKDKNILDKDTGNLAIATSGEITTLTTEVNTLKSSAITDNNLSGKLKALEVLDENGKVKAGVDESQVAGVVVDTLKDKNILDKDTGNLAIATSGEISTLTTEVNTLKSNAITDTNLSGKLKSLNVLDESGNLNAPAVDQDTVNGYIDSRLTTKKVVTLNANNEIDANSIPNTIARSSALSEYAKSSALSQYALASQLNGLATQSYVNEQLSNISAGFDFKGDCGWTTAQTTCSADKDSQACTFNEKMYICGCNGSTCTYTTLNMKGSDGTSFNYTGECGGAAPAASSCTKNNIGNACGFNGYMYICGCNRDNCTYNSIQVTGNPGTNGEPGETAWYAYCMADNNLTNIITPLYSGVTNCSQFTSAQYNAIMGGASAYCLSLAHDLGANMLDLNSGIGKKLGTVLVADSGQQTIGSLKGKSMPTILANKFNGGQTFLSACKAKYNEIMAGDNGEPGETAWYAYCMADNNLTNIITPLYSNVTNCDQFTSTQYNAIMGGAKAYCLSLAKDLSASTLDLTTGIGKKLSTVLVADNGQQTISSLKGKGMSTILGNKFNGSKTFVSACEAKYNEIMAGDNGENGKSAEQTYCEANSSLVVALYSSANPAIASASDCNKFTSDQYQAMMGGAKAYCLLLAKDFVANKLDSSTGVGKKLNEQLKVGSTSNGLFSISGSNRTLKNVLYDTKYNGNATFLSACETKYNEIMAGEKGENGDDGEDAITTWCKAHTVAGNITASTVKKLSAAKLVAAFKAAGNSESKLSKAQDSSGNVEGYFTDLQVCIDAVKNNPDMMNGESASEINYNETVKTEKTDSNITFTLSATKVTDFETKKNAFGSKMVTSDNIGTKLPTDLIREGNVDTKLSGFAKKTDFLDDNGIIKTAKIPTNFVRTGSDNKIDDSLFPTTIAKKTDFLDNSGKINSNLLASDVVKVTDGKISADVLPSKVITSDTFDTTNIVRTTNGKINSDLLASDIVKTTGGKIDDSILPTTVAKKSEILDNNGKLNSGLLSSNIVTTDNATSQLRSAGIATTDADSDVVRIADLANFLRSARVSTTGEVKIDASASNTSAQNLISRLTAASNRGVQVGNINNLQTTTNIADSVAAVTVAAAGSDPIDQTKCLQTDYMYWNTKSASCQKCPDGTGFDKSSSTRCVCKDTTKTFSSTGECVAVSGQAACQAQEGTYWNGSKCLKCPENTYSQGGTCYCEDPEKAFNSTSGTCGKPSAGSCPAKSYWNTRENKCLGCSTAEGAEVGNGGACVCSDQNMVLNTFMGACMPCPDGSTLSNGACVCSKGTLSQEKWTCQ